MVPCASRSEISNNNYYLHDALTIIDYKDYLYRLLPM